MFEVVWDASPIEKVVAWSEIVLGPPDSYPVHPLVALREVVHVTDNERKAVSEPDSMNPNRVTFLVERGGKWARTHKEYSAGVSPRHEADGSERCCSRHGVVAILAGMSNVTQILSQIEQGDPQAASQLLSLVYKELRRLAARKMAHEPVGLTLDATALVHEAYLRLVGGQEQRFDNRGHFFAAAAEAMRRILIDNARRRQSAKRGGKLERHELQENDAVVGGGDHESLLALDEALKKLTVAEPEMARLVELRYFAGLSVEQAAQTLGVSPRTAKRHWAYARAWLRREMDRE